MSADSQQDAGSGVEVWVSPAGTVTVRGEAEVARIDEHFRPPQDAARWAPAAENERRAAEEITPGLRAVWSEGYASGWADAEDRLRAELAETRAAGDALAGAAVEALSLMEHAIHASSPREQRLRDTLEAWRALHSAPPVYVPVALPEKPAEASAAGRSVVCTFCGDEYEHNEVGAVSGYTAACNSCYDAGEPDGVQE